MALVLPPRSEALHELLASTISVVCSALDFGDGIPVVLITDDEEGGAVVQLVKRLDSKFVSSNFTCKSPTEDGVAVRVRECLERAGRFASSAPILRSMKSAEARRIVLVDHELKVRLVNGEIIEVLYDA